LSLRARRVRHPLGRDDLASKTGDPCSIFGGSVRFVRVVVQEKIESHFDAEAAIGLGGLGSVVDVPVGAPSDIVPEVRTRAHEGPRDGHLFERCAGVVLREAARDRGEADAALAFGRQRHPRIRLGVANVIGVVKESGSAGADLSVQESRDKGGVELSLAVGANFVRSGGSGVHS